MSKSILAVELVRALFIRGGVQIPPFELSNSGTEPCQDGGDPVYRNHKLDWGGDRNHSHGGRHRGGKKRLLSKVKSKRRK